MKRPEEKIVVNWIRHLEGEGRFNILFLIYFKWNQQFLDEQGMRYQRKNNYDTLKGFAFSIWWIQLPSTDRRKDYEKKKCLGRKSRLSVLHVVKLRMVNLKMLSNWLLWKAAVREMSQIWSYIQQSICKEVAFNFVRLG